MVLKSKGGGKKMLRGMKDVGAYTNEKENIPQIKKTEFGISFGHISAKRGG